MAGRSRNRVTVLPLWQRLIRERCFHPSGRFIKFESAEIENSISKRFEEQVRRHPNRLAVKAESCGMTYSQLNRAGNRVAGSILAQREDQEKPAAVLMEHGKSLITSIIGVFKSGKIFVPIDPSLPISGISRILEDSNSNIVVTNHRNAALADRLAQNALRVVNIDELDCSISDINPNLPVSADKIAWIMYTSGSTGQPKGTVQSHRNVLHEVMNHINTFRISPNDRLILLDSCSTVGGMKDTLSALLNGSALFPFDLRERNLIELAKWLKRERITIYRSFATVFRHLVATMVPGEVYRDLRLIYLGGEPAYKEDLAAFSQRFSPDCIFTSGLGSTETLTYRHCMLENGAAIDGHTVPVGFDLEGMGVLLLDANDKEVVPGQIGEIAVKSRYLSPGYWRRPGLTRTAFKNYPKWGDERLYRTGDLGRMLPDGCLLHDGRKDSQVKIGGRRVDIFEVEAILLENLGIQEAAVIAQPDQLGGQPPYRWHRATIRPCLLDQIRPGPSARRLPPHFPTCNAGMSGSQLSPTHW